MHDGLDITTVIFALLAVFVVWKLKAVLGTRVDIDKRSRNPPERPSGPDYSGKIVRLPGGGDRSSPPPVSAGGAFDAVAQSEKGRTGLAAVVSADPNFDTARFVSGAKVAYEMIIGAFAAGDRKTLGNLLSPDVLASFASVIAQREAAGERADTKLVSVDGLDVVDAGVKDGVAQVSCRIAAKMINVVRDKNGGIVSGDPETIVSTDDLWTFSRQIANSDPTWRLIATESEHQP